MSSSSSSPVSPGSGERPNVAPPPEKPLRFGREFEKVEKHTKLSLVGRVASGAKTVLGAAVGLPLATLATFPVLPVGFAAFGLDLMKAAKNYTVKHAKQAWKGTSHVVEYRSADVADKPIELEHSKLLSETRQQQLEKTYEKREELDDELDVIQENLEALQTELQQAITGKKPKQEIKALYKKVNEQTRLLRQKNAEIEAFKQNARLLFSRPNITYANPAHEEIFKEHAADLGVRFQALEAKRTTYAAQQTKLADTQKKLSTAQDLQKAFKELQSLRIKLQSEEKKAEKELASFYPAGIPEGTTTGEVVDIQHKITEKMVTINGLITNLKLGDLTDDKDIARYVPDLSTPGGQRLASLGDPLPDSIKALERKIAAYKKEIKDSTADLQKLEEEIERVYGALRSDVETLSKGAKIKAKIDGYQALVNKKASAEEKLQYIQSLGHRNYDPEIRQSIADYVRRPDVRDRLLKSDNRIYLVDTEKGGFIFIPNGLDANADWDSDIEFIRAYDPKTGETIHDSERLSRLARSFGSAQAKIDEWKQEIADKANETNKATAGWKTLSAKDVNVHEFILDFSTGNCYALPNGYNPDVSFRKQGKPIKLGDEVWSGIRKLIDSGTTKDEPLKEKAFPKLPPSTPPSTTTSSEPTGKAAEED